MKYPKGRSIAQPHAPLLMDHLTDFSKEANTNPEVWQVGQLVTLCETSYGPHNPCGSVGLVYLVDTDDPETPYVAIIMESGDDLNLIEALHVHDSFIALGREPFEYDFLSSQLLMADQKCGLFIPFFQAAHRLMNEHG